MAGFFGLFDYTKPGKGIDADAPQKRAVFRYFELLWRNLSRLVLLNFIYFIFMIPVIIAFHIQFFDVLVGYTYTSEGTELLGAPIVWVFSFTFTWPSWLLLALLALSVILQGPLTCGLTYCLRNAVREEHYWRSDMFARAVSNLKQGLALSLLDALVFGVGYVNLQLFFNSYSSMTGTMQFMTILALLALLVYLAMRNTLYTMAVTFELKLSQLIRNAFILSLAGLPRQILVGLVQALIVVLVLMLSGVAELIMLPLAAFMLLGFTAQFVTYPLIEKFMIKPLNESKQEEIQS